MATIAWLPVRWASMQPIIMHTLPLAAELLTSTATRDFLGAA